MAHSKIDVGRALQHVEDAEARIARQRRLISDLRRCGHPTEEAEALLNTMNDLLEQFRELQEDIKRNVDAH